MEWNSQNRIKVKELLKPLVNSITKTRGDTSETCDGELWDTAMKKAGSIAEQLYEQMNEPERREMFAQVSALAAMDVFTLRRHNVDKPQVVSVDLSELVQAATDEPDATEEEDTPCDCDICKSDIGEQEKSFRVLMGPLFKLLVELRKQGKKSVETFRALSARCAELIAGMTPEQREKTLCFVLPYLAMKHAVYAVSEQRKEEGDAIKAALASLVKSALLDAKPKPDKTTGESGPEVTL